jgi:hypothetical protein
MTRVFVAIISLILVFSLKSISKAELDFKYYEGWGFSSKAELDALPEFCIARFSAYGSDKRLYNKWRDIIGKKFIHFHHFCRGLTYLNRAKLEANEKKRNGLLGTAIREMRYTDERCSNNIDPRFRIFFKKNIGQALMLKGSYQEANVEFQKAKILNQKIKK